MEWIIFLTTSTVAGENKKGKQSGGGSLERKERELIDFVTGSKEIGGEEK
jgi:hypothetical protein